MSTLLEQDAKAIEAAISAGKHRNPWKEPVHAVVCATGLSSEQSKDLLRHLLRRKLITLSAISAMGSGGRQPSSLGWWELGPEHPDTPKE